MYQYGVKNRYTPSTLAPKMYGWSGGNSYHSADVPSGAFQGQGGLTMDMLRQQFAYEWLNFGEGGGGALSNPPFVGGAAGRLHPTLQSGSGSARILRGYIRRAEYEARDQMSKTRLYFMYNPEIITRDYVSYLEQSALDPFNTVYQSGNLIAPPSIMNFSFELFFDRQEEAMQVDHPGVFVDYQFFDMVVRNVIPSDPNQTSNTLPDNGVMMVNPRDITIVFSPQITVQGRPTNAQVTFEKFTHRMVPTRMRIQLTVLASYFGPLKDLVEYRKEELPAETSIPIDAVHFSPVDISYIEVEDESDANLNYATDAQDAAGNVNYAGQVGQAEDANHRIRLNALAYAFNHVNQGVTRYNNVGGNRYNLPNSADCSGLITECYIRTLNDGARAMGWNGHPGTSEMMRIAASNQNMFKYRELRSGSLANSAVLQGDILIRDGHTAFVSKASGNSFSIFDAASPFSNPPVGERPLSSGHRYTHFIRPMLAGSTGTGSRSSNWNALHGGSVAV